MWKWLIIGFVGLLVLAGGGAAALMATDAGAKFRAQLTGGETKKKGTPVRLESATIGTLTRTVGAPGTVEPRTKVEISAQVSERVVSLPFREGEYVEAGQIVVELDTTNLQARLTAAEANLRASEARLQGAIATRDAALAEFGRVRELNQSGDRSKAELDRVEAEYLRAKAGVHELESVIETSRAQIIEARKDLENAIIKAPISGTITRLEAEVGELVVVGTLNSPGSVILEIANLGDMVLKAAVDETNIAPVREGQSAIIYINAFDDKEYEGVVERISPRRQVGSDGVGYFEVEVRMVLSEGETLRSGYTANTDIAVESFEDVLLVPSQAVLERRIDELPKDVLDTAGAWLDRTKTFARCVFVMRDGKAMVTPVRIGASDLTRTVVEAGLAADDRVVSGPYKVLLEVKHQQAIEDMDAKQEAEESKGDTPEAVAQGAGESSGSTDSNTSGTN
ncbi:MAG: efflux RND transporter periplasmic adaptor subunit [Phycisphaerales bacterium]|nr:efflux RND transporter periplasmic adaptor subunit [Phycisphaerales bacterium]